MPEPEISESMVNLAHAFVETRQLRAWFYALEHLRFSIRQTTFLEMAAQMRKAGEDAALADAVAALADPRIYQSVLNTIRERIGDKTV